MHSATKSSSRAHRRFPLHGQNTTPSVSFFSRGSFRPKKYFPTARFESYLLSTLPPPHSLSLFLPPFWSSRTNLYRARRGDGHATLARRCVSAWALRFGAGSILISIQSRTISSGSTFEENERTRVRFAPPFNPPTPSSLCSAGWPSVAIFEYSESGKNYVNRRIPRSRRSAWRKVEERFMIFIVCVSIINRGKIAFFLTR